MITFWDTKIGRAVTKLQVARSDENKAWEELNELLQEQ